MTKTAVLEVKGLSKVVESGGFLKASYSVKAVQEVSFELFKGETLGVVGESGCGKSTLARCVLNLVEPTSGEIRLDGNLLAEQNKKEWRNLRTRLQVIFQDPFSSLNPKRKIGQTLAEPLKVHEGKSYDEVRPSLEKLMQEEKITVEVGKGMMQASISSSLSGGDSTPAAKPPVRPGIPGMPGGLPTNPFKKTS